MSTWNRRDLLRCAGLAAAGGVLGVSARWPGEAWAGPQLPVAPEEILNPVEVSGAEAVPVIGQLPGSRRMYVLAANLGEHHTVGGHVMTRIARPADTAGVYELATFAGRTGATMPRHLHRSSHAALLVMNGEVELELDGQRWRMLRGDFANIPPGTPHAWTMRSDRGQLALFTMNDRVGSAFTAMGAPASGAAAPTDVSPAPPGKLADAAYSGDFQLVPEPAPAKEAVRVTNLMLPLRAGPYVLLDGGGERFGGNTFLAKNANTTGQFLFLITEGGAGPGVGAHFHARHFENFFALDGETLGWAYGKAVSLKTGDYFQAPPRNLHGFKLTQTYNRFAAFLTPGIFEAFFTRGGPGQNGVGRAARGEAPGGGRGEAEGRRGGAPGRGRGEAGGADMFRSLSMGGRGPDGYPLDVHGAKLPLPPQDPVWTEGRQGDADGVAARAALLAHAQALCGISARSRIITPELRQALTLKPRAEDFI
jgi:quercetin 2,3-dioxygenase